MLKDTAISLYIFFYSLFCGCGSDWRDSGFEKLTTYKIRKTGRVDQQKLAESSGLIAAESQTLWAINDGGNSNELFRITYSGQIIETVKIEGATNIDWEDLARDNTGNIYIGDFGNNANNRKDLCIYKVREADKKLLGKIRFHYPDQTAFPPPEEKRNFDCEAMIWQNGQLYLFSKDWRKTKKTKLYQLPDSAGYYTAQLLDSVRINTWITAAGTNPDSSLLSLLGYGKIYLFAGNAVKNGLSSSRFCIPFRRSAQAEAVVFIDSSRFIISNEQGKLFLAQPKKQQH